MVESASLLGARLRTNTAWLPHSPLVRAVTGQPRFHKNWKQTPHLRDKWQRIGDHLYFITYSEFNDKSSTVKKKKKNFDLRVHGVHLWARSGPLVSSLLAPFFLDCMACAILVHWDSPMKALGPHQWCGSRSVMSNLATPWTIQSMEFSRPEYWSG